MGLSKVFPTAGFSNGIFLRAEFSPLFDIGKEDKKLELQRVSVPSLPYWRANAGFTEEKT